MPQGGGGGLWSDNARPCLESLVQSVGLLQTAVSDPSNLSPQMRNTNIITGGLCVGPCDCCPVEELEICSIM